VNEAKLLQPTIHSAQDEDQSKSFADVLHSTQLVEMATQAQYINNTHTATGTQTLN